MAYVLGFIFADGSLEDSPYIRGKYLRATSTDQDRIEAIKNAMSSAHTVITEKRDGNRRTRYVLRIGSHTLYDDLMRLGVTPRKSHSMKFPVLPRKYFPAFVRGYFDGDGCVFIDRLSKDQTPRRLMIIFTSGSIDFLQSLHDCLRRECAIEEHCLHAHSKAGAFQLRYSMTSSVKIFPFLYKESTDPRLYLSRKYAIFRRFFTERPDKVTSAASRVLVKINIGHVVKG